MVQAPIQGSPLFIGLPLNHRLNGPHCHDIVSIEALHPLLLCVLGLHVVLIEEALNICYGHWDSGFAHQGSSGLRFRPSGLIVIQIWHFGGHQG